MAPLALVDLKLTEKQSKAQNEISPSKGPRYPWGLSLNLENDVIEKLDIDFDTANVGKEYTATVVLKVTSKSANESTGGKSNKSLGVQITKMDVQKSKFDKYHKQQNARPGE